jgi:hypothetical protein
MAALVLGEHAYAQKDVYDLKTKYTKTYKTVTVTHLKMFEGNCELVGQFIDQQGEKTFWVKNAELKTGDKVMLYFGMTLRNDNIQVVEQIPAIYGYIVEVTGNNLLSVWVTDENGIRNSDEIIVNIKEDEAYVQYSGE